MTMNEKKVDASLILDAQQSEAEVTEAKPKKLSAGEQILKMLSMKKGEEKPSINTQDIKAKVLTFFNEKNANTIFIVGLVIVLLAFAAWRFHGLSRTPDNAPAVSTPTASVKTVKNNNDIPMAGVGVVPDEQGFSQTSKIEKATEEGKSKDELVIEMANINVQMDELNQTLSSMQEAITDLSSLLKKDKAQPGKTIVNVLGVIQNPNDGIWHADITVNGQNFDVISGDRIAGIQIVDVSAEGVDWRYAG